MSPRLKTVAKTHLLIIGCGYVGSAIAKEAVADGMSVWCICRTKGSAPNGASEINLDINSPNAILPLGLAFDYIVYCISADRAEEAAYRSAYVEGAAGALRMLSSQRKQIRRFIYVSSTGVYPQQDGSLVDESSEVGGESFSSKILLEGEKIIASSGIPYCIVRLGGIYGPNRNSLIEQVRSGVAPLTSRSVYTNRIHRDDCAGAIIHLLKLARPENYYIGVDTYPATKNEVIIWLSEQLGVTQITEELASGPSDNRRGGNKQCSSLRLQRSGYKFRFPTFREGYKLLIAELT